MKALYLFVLLVLLSTVLYAQRHKKISLTNWLKQNKYTALTDTGNLPRSIMPYYAAIKDAINNPPAHIKNFPRFYTSYTNATVWNLVNNQTILSFTIYPIEGLKQFKQEQEYQPKPVYDGKTKIALNTDVRTLGSIGQVILKLDKATNKITFTETE